MMYWQLLVGSVMLAGCHTQEPAQVEYASGVGADKPAYSHNKYTKQKAKVSLAHDEEIISRPLQIEYPENKTVRYLPNDKKPEPHYTQSDDDEALDGPLNKPQRSSYRDTTDSVIDNIAPKKAKNNPIDQEVAKKPQEDNLYPLAAPKDKKPLRPEEHPSLDSNKNDEVSSELERAIGEIDDVTPNVPGHLSEHKAQDDSELSLPIPQKHDADDIAVNLMPPVQGRIIAKFGDMVNNAKNKGINYAAAEGDPVFAAESGVVEQVSRDVKFGNLIIIGHKGNLQTAYAHMQSIAKIKGTKVKRGEIIGYVGVTGQVNIPQLHFAVRKDKAPIDPQELLGK